MILSQAIIADIVPAKDRGKYMGPFGAIFGISAVAGPLLGGLFVDHLTWEWCFYINIPVGIAAFAVGYIALKLPNKRAERRIDIPGIVALSLATTGLIFFTDFGSNAMIWMTPAASTPIWLVCVMMFVFGLGLGCIMQVIVLVVQNSVPANDIGSATSTNNFFRGVGASLGVAIFGSLFTTNLAGRLTGIFTAAGASTSQASGAGASLDPTTLKTLPQPIRESIVNAYADSLAPVFWYLVPFLAVAFVLALFIRQIKPSDVSGMVPAQRR